MGLNLPNAVTLVLTFCFQNASRLQIELLTHPTSRRHRDKRFQLFYCQNMLQLEVHPKHCEWPILLMLCSLPS